MCGAVHEVSSRDRDTFVCMQVLRQVPAQFIEEIVSKVVEEAMLDGQCFTAVGGMPSLVYMLDAALLHKAGSRSGTKKLEIAHMQSYTQNQGSRDTLSQLPVRFSKDKNSIVQQHTSTECRT
jgi:hypothetical protein